MLPALLGVAATVPGRARGAEAPAGERSTLSNLKGRVVEAVRVRGNKTVPTAVILNVVRTREGDKLDPATVEEDYQRIFGLRKFSNVEAKVEPTAAGAIVLFSVVEQSQVADIFYRGNVAISTEDLQEVVDLKPGQAIDPFRIAMARQAVERLYRERNFPYAHVEVVQGELTRKGNVVFLIIEGPNVRVRDIQFVGNRHFTGSRLLDQVRSRTWIWIFRPGTLDFDQLEDDVAALRQYYQSKGFFDVRVGRKIIVSPDQKEVQIDFVIDEGPRYVVSKVSFVGNSALSDAKLRANLKLPEGQPFDAELIQRDIRQIVRDYSPFGFIYQPASDDPDYFRVGRRDYPYGAKVVFEREPGRVEIVYEIHEGKPFRLGRILVKGNEKTQDKVVLREMRVAPGQLYDSSEIQDAVDRLRATPYFESVTITPIGADPDSRDLLVEVLENRTATFTVGAGVNSNGGVGGNITYEQKNFDIANPPSTWRDIFSDRAWTGAGQSLRISLEPGTQQTNASVRWSEPWLFDQPYSYSIEGYLRHRQREKYDENRLGGRTSFGKRFDFHDSAVLTFRGEDVAIKNIDAPRLRAPEILQYQGHNTVTSIGLQLRRDTTEGGFIPYKGDTAVLNIEEVGGMGGEFYFPKLQLGYDRYFLVYEDLLERRTTLGLHLDSGWIPTNDAPFFEKFYGGGIGSVRGFGFRGISPRSGRDNDAVGGNFMVAGSLELSFPIASEFLRGVVFTDAGTVEEDVRVTTIRSSVGAGVRIILPLFGGAPLALDFAYPITKDERDDVQYISFSFGVTQ